MSIQTIRACPGSDGKSGLEPEWQGPDAVLQREAAGWVDRLLELSNQVNGVGLAIIDAQARYIEVNQLFATLSGMPKDSYAGRSVCELVPDTGPMLARLVDLAVQTGRPIRDIRFTARVPYLNGSVRDRLASFFPVRLSRTGVGVAHIVVEIADRSRVEAAVAELAPGMPQSRRALLTSREVDVLGLIGQGKTTKEIAALLSISIQTVGNHRKQICRKVNLHSTAEMVAFGATYFCINQLRLDL